MQRLKLHIIVTFLSSLLALFGCKDKQKLPPGSSNDTYSTVDTTKFYPPNSKDTLQPTYFETAKLLWQSYVPKSGQAETQQGELIRIVERLDYEIRGNAKANWNEQYVILANSLRDTLINSNTFPEEIEEEIKNDINSLTRSEDELFLEDEIYNRLARRIVEWYWRHQEPIKHEPNPKLKI